MAFKEFKTAMQKQFSKMVKDNDILFLTDVAKDDLWNTYLDSFPEGTNPIYKERRAYDCVACRQFIRPFGNVVAIKDNKLISIWDVEVEGYYKDVANKMARFVKEPGVINVFVSKYAKLGTDCNHQIDDSKKIITWEHFYFELPQSHVNRSADSIEAIQGQYRDNKNVFQRSITELKKEATETVLDLISQGSLYRGDEFKKNLGLLLKYQTMDIPPVNEIMNWFWINSINNPVCRIRNSSIGTLLIDLSDGLDLDAAVAKFEKVVAPTNYKRPKAIFTKKMVEDAESKIIELGYDNSLGRRYAITEDITVNNVLFANRDTKKKMNASVFDDLKEDVSINPKKLGKVEEVSIEDFVNNILPNSTNIELMTENKHQNNLMSLISPQDIAAKSMFKWANNFSWAYNGDITDSMKERVKSAGGRINGVLRFSIQWNDGDNNQNDFDAHCLEPNHNLIHYPNKGKIHPSSGMLDVDIVTPGNKIAVENITWNDKDKMQDGRYKFIVDNYAHCGGTTGFTAEIEYEGQIYSYAYNKELKNKEKVLVAEVEFNKETGIKFIKSLDSTKSSKEVWGIKTNKFQKVSMIMNSPNHWDEQTTGNIHYFFILDGCVNEGTPRGFFNEFLTEGLLKHKRVFEALGSKMRVEHSDNQLSGLGFSSTQRNSIIAKIEGNFTRIIKINF